MYIPSSLPGGVRLFSTDGHSWDFPSLAAFVETYGFDWIRSSVGPSFRIRGEPGFLDVTYPYVLRDLNDEVISHEDCYQAWRGIRARLYRPRSLSWRFDWRGEGPVPGTGKRPGGRAYRRPSTLTSYRANAAVLRFEGEPAFRGRRSPKVLPSAREDRLVAARRDRSWKRYRRTRWKASRE